MSIMIKGLDIPKSEHERITVQIGSDGEVYLVTDFELKAEVYKFNAVEVPEPHGRLIDADKLVDAIASLIPMPTDVGPYELGFCDGIGRVQIELEDSAPTVIEAEEARA